jgi:NADPH:quinone reductase-like Zn-dependent oxidoreductase
MRKEMVQMKAIVYEKYGTPEVIELKEVEKPVPNDDEVLVKVYAASLNAYDWHFLTADIFLIRLIAGGIFRPKRTSLGADFAGRVEAVGKNIRQFAPGDAVYGEAYGDGGGAFGEYVVVPEKRLALKPANLSFEQAAAVPMAGLTALQGLRDKGGIQAGQKVVIQGASGGVGTYAVQIAKTFGAEVTAVCSTRNVEQARSLGADHVIDYTQEDFTQNGQQYKLIFAANGYHPISAYKRALAPQGVYIMAGGTVKQLFQGVVLGSWMSRGGDKKMGTFTAETKQEDLITLKEMLEAGKVTPVIDRTYPLSETAEAMRYLGQGHARGKIVIHVAQDDASGEIL